MCPRRGTQYACSPAISGTGGLLMGSLPEESKGKLLSFIVMILILIIIYIS